MVRIDLITLILATSLWWGCGRKTVSQVDQTAADSTLRPDSEVSGATILLYDRDLVTAEIRSHLMRRFEAVDSTVGYVLDIDFFDSAGHKTSNLIADSGVIREKNDRLEVFGKVVVITEDSARLDTKFLRWNPERHKIESDAFVKFTRRSDVMTGWGMEADPDLGRLKILSQVSGSVTEVSDSTGQ
ncbi:MAG: LPS export ABC transporter periplasmic protein LptC [Candidatus Zixiibacteriota bacterium]